MGLNNIHHDVVQKKTGEKNISASRRPSNCPTFALDIRNILYGLLPSTFRIEPTRWQEHLLRGWKYRVHKLVVVQLDNTTTIGIKSLERLC